MTGNYPFYSICSIIQLNVIMKWNSLGKPISEGICAVPCFNEELVASIKLLLPDSEEVRATATLYSALADPTRLRVLIALTFGELCVCDVAHVLGLSVAAASHQLRFLRNLGVVSHRTDGKMAYYSIPESTPLKVEIERALLLYGLAENSEAQV